MSAGPDLSFVVPVRNDAARLRNCLASIRANDAHCSTEIIVVDNGSTDDSFDVAVQAGARALRLPGASVARVRNAAVDHASGAIIAFVDADHLVASGWAAAAVDIFANPQIAAAGAPYSAPAHGNWVQRAYARLRPAATGQTDTEWLASGNLVIRKPIFRAIGGFDETLESCEDVDLCNRLRKVGHRLVSDERLRSVHVGDPSTLRALFFGELWRGRDNFRVTLRGGLSARSILSLMIPVVHLLCFGLLLAGLWLGPLALVAVAIGGALTLLRALRMIAARPLSGLQEFVQCLVVAAVYDAARALALVFRATHRTRREVAGERVIV